MLKNVITIVAFVLLLLGSGVGAYMFVKQADENSQSHLSSNIAERSDANKRSDRNEACGLFSKEIIAAALGGSYEDGVEGYASSYAQSIANPGSGDQGLKNWACEFSQESDDTAEGRAAALNFSITINNFSNTTDAKKYMDTFLDPNMARNFSEVSGIGEQAFFPDFGKEADFFQGIEMLYFRVGDKVFVLGAGSENAIDRAAVRAGLTELANKV